MRGSESQKISLKMHNFPEFSLLNFPKNFGLRYFSKLKKKKSTNLYQIISPNPLVMELTNSEVGTLGTRRGEPLGERKYTR